MQSHSRAREFVNELAASTAPKKVKDFIGLGEEKHFHDALNDRMNNG